MTFSVKNINFHFGMSYPFFVDLHWRTGISWTRFKIRMAENTELEVTLLKGCCMHKSF